MGKIKQDCPFCGNEADTNDTGRGDAGKYYLSCMGAECGATGPTHRTLDLAIEAWNGRPAQLTAEEQLEWLWGNCRIIHQDVAENYPIEHCQWAKKDSRAFIEAQMPNRGIDGNFPHMTVQEVNLGDSR